MPELPLVGPLVAAEHGLGVLPAAELAKHLQRLVHEVGCELPPQGVLATETLALQLRKRLGLFSTVPREPAAHAREGILGRGQQGSVPDPGVVPPRFLQNDPWLGGHRRPILVASPLVLAPPPDGPAIEVDVGPPELADGRRAEGFLGFKRDECFQVCSRRLAGAGKRVKFKWREYRYIPAYWPDFPAILVLWNQTRRDGKDGRSCSPN